MEPSDKKHDTLRHLDIPCLMDLFRGISKALDTHLFDTFYRGGRV